MAFQSKVCTHEVFMLFNARRRKMNRFGFFTFCIVAVFAESLQIATAQMMNATVQTASPRVVASRSAPAAAGKSVANARVAPQVVARPMGVPAQRFNSNLPRTVARAAKHFLPNYSAGVGISNPAFAALNVQRSAPGQQAITLDPATRQTELRTLAAIHQRRGVVTRDGNILDPAARQNELHTLATMREHRRLVTPQANMPDAARRDGETPTLGTIHEPRTFGGNNQTLATINPQRHVTNRDREAGPQREKPKYTKDTHRN